MNIPEAVSTWLVDHHHGKPCSVVPVGGGCINNGARIRTEDDASFFLKQNSRAPDEMFAREAQGLQALQFEEGPRVPTPFLWGTDFLLLEDLQPGRKKEGYWNDFGHHLAKLHDQTHSAFGFDHDNFIGSTPQVNKWTEDGHEFFAEHRLGYQADLASRGGYFEPSDREMLDALIERLPELIPQQPASLIHGDLWSGNAISDDQGNPAMIDPAAHYGWAEAELGMTALFGGFSEDFYDAYTEARPLPKGWRDRLPLYNLYHLINHVNLFGHGYLGQVRAILNRFK